MLMCCQTRTGRCTCDTVPLLRDAAALFGNPRRALSGHGTLVYGCPVDGKIQHDGPSWPYLQLAGELRLLIAGKDPHSPLPSIKRLAQDYGLSEKTVRKALAVLEAEDRIYVVPSRGAFVKPH
jgi:GntR family transcriptional regulator